MQFLRSENLMADLLFGIVFSLMGVFFILRRKMIISALLSSSKIFWQKMHMQYNNEESAVLTNIMIPIIGGCFLIIGLLMLCKVINYFLG